MKGQFGKSIRSQARQNPVLAKSFGNLRHKERADRVRVNDRRLKECVNVTSSLRLAARMALFCATDCHWQMPPGRTDSDPIDRSGVTHGTSKTARVCWFGTNLMPWPYQEFKAKIGSNHISTCYESHWHPTAKEQLPKINSNMLCTLLVINGFVPIAT